MIFNIEDSLIVMFGGVQVKDRAQPLYIYEGINWQRVPSSGDWPVWRSHFGMAYDASRNVVVVFGGFQGGSDYLGDTWEWDGSQWEEKFPEQNPTDRYGVAMTYEESTNLVYLFGGSTESFQSSDELWIWDGVNWIDISPDTGPSARLSARMVDDSDRNKIVLFGGTDDGNTELHDTWEWDGIQWEEVITPLSPTGKRSHTLVFDSNRHVTVLFGGNDDPYGLSQETWEYDGIDWFQIQTVHKPVARRAHAACYDSTRGRIVMYGGYSETGSLNDTWEYYDVPTPTPSPTETPTPTATPPVTGVTIDMPSHLFHPDDLCFCKVTVTNAEPDPLTNHPLFVILDAYGVYFFAPSFTQTPETYSGPWPAGNSDIEVIPEFAWPDTGTGASGLFFYAALTDPAVTHIVGEWDTWEFGWE